MKINKIRIKFNIFAMLITLSVFLLLIGAKNIAYAEEAAKETEKTEETKETDETKDAKKLRKLRKMALSLKATSLSLSREVLMARTV